MLAEVLNYIDLKQRQLLRGVSHFWKKVIEDFFGICLSVNNINWNGVQDCSCATSIVMNGFSRDVLNPEIISCRLTKLEITDFIAYYSLMPILDVCYMLQSLVINCVTFLKKSQLAEYKSQEYMNRKGKRSWLPRLKYFKFISCTTQDSVYNHIVPSDLQDDTSGLGLGMEDSSRALYDISRGEMEFIPFILEILCHAKSLAHVEMVLTDIWKVPFAELLQINAEPPSPEISLWHFGSKRLLPIGGLLQQHNSITTLRFSFPYHFDTFYMKFKQPQACTLKDANPHYQLEEVVVQQSIRWSQEMSQVDVPWLQILEAQTSLKILEYPFPVFGNDDRMANILVQNCKTLQKIVFTGHRQERALLEEFRGGRLHAWDANWFAPCENLEELSIKSHTRFLLTPTVMASIEQLSLLPQSLKHFTFQGCINAGNGSLSQAFLNLVNLESFTHQARNCPWFKIDDVSTVQMQVSHAVEILLSLPKLNKWTLEWSECDLTASIILRAVTNSQCASLSKELLDWLMSSKEGLEFSETSLDRQLRSLKIQIVSRKFLSEPLDE